MTVLSHEPQKSIPHAPPFLWVSRLIERNDEGTEGRVEYDVQPDDEIFKGHFPGNPIFPGVLQCEGAAQACLWVKIGAEGPPPTEVFFVAIDSYKFRKPVIPPATITYHVKRSKARRTLEFWDIEVRMGDDVVSQGAFLVKMGS